MANEITIPALPSISINDTLAFYVALGFEITYQQARPNTYACVKRDDIELHFFAMKGIEPANSYSTCLVIIESADTLYQVFKDGLKQHFGKIPVAGIPRITRPNNNNAAGDYRFNVVDPSGNWVRFIQITPQQADSAPSGKLSTALSRAIHGANLLVDAKGDFSTAATMLDKALTQYEPSATTIELVQAWRLRTDIAVNMDDKPLANQYLAKLRQLVLTDAEQMILHDDLQRLDELEDGLV